MDVSREVTPPSPAASQPVAAAPTQLPSGGFQPAVAAADPRRKSPLLAMVLSCMPGLGQIYVGYYQRGFVHAIVVAVLITLASAGNLGGLEPLVGLPLSFFWLYNVVDAGRKAQLFNQALAGGTPIELPQDLKMPSMGGSIFGGLTVLAAGFVLLLHTKFDVPLDWLAEWWPVGVMVFGAYLVYRAVQDRAATRSLESNDA